MYRKQYYAILTISLLLPSLLYFSLIHPNRLLIHEQGHLYATKLIYPEYECEILPSIEFYDSVQEINAEGALTVCPIDIIGETTPNERLIILTSGYGFEFLLALLLLLSPASTAGGIWMLDIARMLLLHNNIHQADFAFMPYWAKAIISAMLLLLFLSSLLIQKYYIKKFFYRKI